MLSTRRVVMSAFFAAFAITLVAFAEEEISSKINYQASVKRNDAVATGACDVRFKLWDADAGGAEVEPMQEVLGVALDGGVLTTAFDFGDQAFKGKARWLEVHLKCTGDPDWTELTPRQEMTAIPYSMTKRGETTIYNAISPSTNAGASENTIEPTAIGVTVTGGTPTEPNAAYDDHTSCGGKGNICGTNNGDPTDATGAAAPYGEENTAAGKNSLALGNRARALHKGAVVIQADSDLSRGTPAYFDSTADNQFLIRATGGVGIGKNNPAAALDVGGDVHSDGVLSSGNTINVDGMLREIRADADLDIFVTGAPNRMTITAGGDVGIGTTSPSAKLDVVGSLEVDATTLVVDAANNRVGIGTASPSSTVDIVGSLEVDATTLFVDAPNNSVGIGTITPSEKLHVQTGNIRVDTTTPGGGVAIVGNDTNDVALSISNGGGIHYIFDDDSDGHALKIEAAATDCSIGSVGGSRIRLYANGTASVGTGTFSPTEELEIHSIDAVTSLDINNEGADGDPQVRFLVNNVATFSMGVDDSDADKLKIGTSGPATSTRMTIDAGGNVGIGTASPAQRLSVAGTVQSTSGGFMFPDASVQTTASNADGHSLDASDGSPVDALFVDAQGDVGIGTTSPGSHRLFVTGTSTGVSGATLHAENTSAGSGIAGNFRSVGTDSTVVIGNDGTGDMLRTFSAFQPCCPLVKITNDGCVGIGGTSQCSLGANINTSLHVFPHPDDPDATEYAAWFESFTRTEAAGTTVAYFNRESNDGTVISIMQAGTQDGTISTSAGTVSYNPFTGSHFGWTDETLDRGTLVVMTGDNRIQHDREVGEEIYGMAPSSTPNDSRCLGSYLGVMESSKPADSSNPHLIMAVGNGDIWVVDSGRNIEPGDYLISSDVRGHAMLDDENRFPVGYVIARAGERVDWSGIVEAVDGRKHRKISVFYESFVRGSAVAVGGQLESLRAELDELRRSNAELSARIAALPGQTRVQAGHSSPWVVGFVGAGLLGLLFVARMRFHSGSAHRAG